MSPVTAIAASLTLSFTVAQAPERRLSRTVHHFDPPAETASGDACRYCHVPSRMTWAVTPAPAWAPQAAGKNAALDARGDPAGPPLALRWAGSTLRCLSCHDATVSSIAVVYRPQSSSLVDDLAAPVPARSNPLRAPGLYRDWGGEVMGNHPVSVPYPAPNVNRELWSFRPRAEPQPAFEWQSDPKVAGLKLVADATGFDALRGTLGVECVSCHDPHGTPNTFFLRVPKERSELCLSCHRK